MKQFIEFLQNNYILICTICINLGVFVLTLIRRNKTNIIDNSYIHELSLLIKEAESKYGSGNGALKLQYVLNKYIENKNTVYDSSARKVVIQTIEWLLSLPQKKG